MNKSYRKQEHARQMEARGKRTYGRRPKRRDREIIFTPWATIMKERRRRRKYGIEVGG